MAPMPDGPDAMPEVAAVMYPVAMPSLKVLLSEEGRFGMTFLKPALQLPIFFSTFQCFQDAEDMFWKARNKQTERHICRERNVEPFSTYQIRKMRAREALEFSIFVAAPSMFQYK